jgi:hypothetical protein
MLTDRRDPDAPTVERHLGGVIAQPCQVHSVVVEPARGRLHLGAAAAPVGDGAWITLDVDWDGAPGAWQLDQPRPPDLGVSASAGPHRPRPPAADLVARAMAFEQTAHDPDATAAALTEAVALAPGDPSLRLALTWTAMRQGRWSAAQASAAAGLAVETLPYRRGQLLRWGARAATVAGDPTTAAAWRAELAALPGEALTGLRAAARGRRPGLRPGAAPAAPRQPAAPRSRMRIPAPDRSAARERAAPPVVWYRIYRHRRRRKAGVGDVATLPYSLRILLENLLRYEDGKTVSRADIAAVASWNPAKRESSYEVQLRPARVLMQDFTGVPCGVDLATMREAFAKLGRRPHPRSTRSSPPTW